VTEGDIFPFMETFRSVTRVFPLRGEEHEIRDVGASYFKAMRRRSLPEVQAGADVWMSRGKKFPKPAEWLESIPSSTLRPESKSLSDDEAHAWLQAEQSRWEGIVCGCRSCVAAGITEFQPLRFVPEVDASGHDRKALIGERSVTMGHWAHGQELADWYTAKRGFYEQCAGLKLGDPLRPRERRTAKTLTEAAK
jgi:hypothetical protein